MYIHGELIRHGFELKAIQNFGNAEKCSVDYEFKNDNITATINRRFDGKMSLKYSENGSDEEVEFIELHVDNDAHIIHLVRNFLKKHS